MIFDLLDLAYAGPGEFLYSLKRSTIGINVSNRIFSHFQKGSHNLTSHDASFKKLHLGHMRLHLGHRYFLFLNNI